MPGQSGPGWPAPPTKSITAPDGSVIHYPDLPGVGEPHRHDDPAAREAQTQPHQAAKETIPTVNSESLRERLTNAARAVIERTGGLANSAFHVLIKDDIDKLVGAHSTPLKAPSTSHRGRFPKGKWRRSQRTLSPKRAKSLRRTAPNMS